LAAARAAVALSPCFVQVRDPRRLEMLTHALTLIEPLPPGPELVTVLTEIADEHMIWRRAEIGLEYAERALALADRLGLPRPARTVGFRAINRSYLGDPGAEEDFREALALAEQAGQGRETVTLYTNYGVHLGAFEGPARSAPTFRAGIAFA